MRRVTGWTRARWRGWSYRPAVSHPVMRRLLPGYALSALGDGMSAVGVAWLALQLSPPASRGAWTGAALAAYTLPGALGMLVFGRWLRGRRSVRIAGADAALRAVALGAIPVLAVAHLLSPPVYVCLLAISSLLHAWGSAGQFALIAEILPPQHRVAGNGLLSMSSGIALIGGPALAGLVAAVAGPAAVIAADACTFAVLAGSYAWAAPLIPGPPAAPAAPAEPAAAAAAAIHSPAAPAAAAASPSTPAAASPSTPAAASPSTPAAALPSTPAAAAALPSTPAASGQQASGAVASGPAAGGGQADGGSWRIIRSSPVLLGLLALTFVFYFLYGPVEVALPVHVAGDLHGSAALLGAFWTAFAIGAVPGTLTAPWLRRWPVWPTMTGIVAGWGLGLLPLGLGAPVWAALAAFAAGGMIYAPYTSLSIAVFQDASPAGQVAPVLASRAVLVIMASPVGTALGGPVVALLGAQRTLLWSALTTIGLAVLAALVPAAARTLAARRGAAAPASGEVAE